MSFEFCLPVILKFEGGYANNPNDPGGATNKGITQLTYNYYRRTHHLSIRSVKEIEDKEVHEIYEKNYFRACSAHIIPETYLRLQLFHFDTAVNCGVITAIRQLQAALGVKDDGVFGPITAKAILNQKEDKIVRKYAEYRTNRYKRLAERNPKLEEFLDSWFHRVACVCTMKIPTSS